MAECVDRVEVERVNWTVGPVVRSQPHVRGWKPYQMAGDEDRDVVSVAKTPDAALDAMAALGIGVRNE